MVLVLPRRSNSCSWSTRSSLGCSSGGMSPTSSRNKCPPVRQLEAPDLLADGPGEGALLVAKQLALQQPRGDGRTIQFDEGAALARAQVVNGAGDQLLTRAGFAPNEHRGAGGGDRLHLLEDAGGGRRSPR